MDRGPCPHRMEKVHSFSTFPFGCPPPVPLHLHLKQQVPAHISLPICKQRSCQGIRKSGGRHVLSQALGRQAQEEEEVKEEEKVEEEEVEKEEEEEEAKSLQFELSSS